MDAFDDLITPQESFQNNEPDEIDRLLNEYKETPKTQGESGSGETSRTSDPSGGNENTGTKYADPYAPNGYYKTGAKKGLPKPASANTTIKASALISGALLISLIDIFIPMLICGVNNWKFKTKVDPEKMKLKDEQKKELAPLADAMVRELNISASPTALLIVGLLGIYGGNFMLLKNEASKEEAEKQRNKMHRV